MAWAFSQSPTTVVEVDGDGILAIVLGSAVASGDRVIAAFTYRDVFSGALTVDSVSDSLGNTYARDLRTVITEDGTHYRYVETWSAPVTVTGTPTITVNISSGDPNLLEVAAVVYTGLDTSASPVDVSVGAAGSGTAVASGSTGSTTAANELVLGVIALPSNGGNSSLTASGYTLRASLLSAFFYGLWVGDKDSGSSSTTHSIASTLGDSSEWGAQAIVYKLSGGAAAASIRRSAMLTMGCS